MAHVWSRLRSIVYFNFSWNTKFKVCTFIEVHGTLHKIGSSPNLQILYYDP